MPWFRDPYPPRLFPLPRQSKAVKRASAAFAIMLFAASLALSGASAETRPGTKAKTTNSPASNAAVIECFKRSGGSYDPVTKKWTVHMGENDATVRTDTLRQCIGRATGASPGSITLRERWHYY
jgi:hypothetical protein